MLIEELDLGQIWGSACLSLYLFWAMFQKAHTFDNFLFHKHACKILIQLYKVVYDCNVALMCFPTSDVAVLSSKGVEGFFIAGSI